jgi:hypothetical protein
MLALPVVHLVTTVQDIFGQYLKDKAISREAYLTSYAGF